MPTLNVMSPAGAVPSVSAVMYAPFVNSTASAVIAIVGEGLVDPLPLSPFTEIALIDASAIVNWPPRITTRPAASALVSRLAPCASMIFPNLVNPFHVGSAGCPPAPRSPTSPGEATLMRAMCPPGTVRRAG